MDRQIILIQTTRSIQPTIWLKLIALMYVLCWNIVPLYGHLTHLIRIARLIKQRKCNVSSQRQLLDCGQYHMFNVRLYFCFTNLNIVAYFLIWCYVIKFLMVKSTLIYRMSSSSILSLLLVHMLLSCTNFNVVLTVLNNTLLIVLFIYGIIYQKT